MKCEEALYRFIDFAYSQGVTTAIHEEMIATIKEALEKQIPKKPTKTGFYHVKAGVQYCDWLCPACKRALYRKKLTDDECCPLTVGFAHHCICGQAISWEA